MKDEGMKKDKDFLFPSLILHPSSLSRRRCFLIMLQQIRAEGEEDFPAAKVGQPFQADILLRQAGKPDLHRRSRAEGDEDFPSEQGYDKERGRYHGQP